MAEAVAACRVGAPAGQRGWQASVGRLVDGAVIGVVRPRIALGPGSLLKGSGRCAAGGDGCGGEGGVGDLGGAWWPRRGRESTARGTGISGWETNMVPAWPAWRAGAGRRQQAVLGAAGLGSVEPTDDLIEEFDTIRRSTSEAVCWAPIRTTPSEPPRSAMSSSTFLDRRILARRVLVEFIDHREQQPARLAGLAVGRERARHRQRTVGPVPAGCAGPPR